MREDLRALRLFNEKANKLESLTFTGLVLQGKHGVRLNLDQSRIVSMDRTGPSQEDLDAFVLTFRFFVQNNEPSSIANVARLYESLPLDDETLRSVKEWRAVINAYLDSDSNVKVGGSPVTNRYIFGVFMWGGLAHAAPEHAKTFELWASRGQMFLFLEAEFMIILATLLSAVFWLRDLNREVLALLDEAIAGNR